MDRHGRVRPILAGIVARVLGVSHAKEVLRSRGRQFGCTLFCRVNNRFSGSCDRDADHTIRRLEDRVSHQEKASCYEVHPHKITADQADAFDANVSADCWIH